MLPQSDLPSVEEHFVAFGRQILLLVGVADLEHGDILGVAHAPLICATLGVLKNDSRAPGLSSGSPAVTPVSAATASSLAAAAALASPSLHLLKRLTAEQRASILRVWKRLPSHLPAVAFDLHGQDRTPLTI